VTLLTLLAAARPAQAEAPASHEPEGPMHPAAQALYDRALAAFGAHDYASAIRDTEAGYALDPRREFLFTEAQAKRLSGDCRGAVVLYQRFLTTQPPALQVDATHIALARCAQELATRPPLVVVTPAPPPPRPPAPRWWRDPWGWSLSAAGLAGLGLGLGWFVAAEVARSDAQSATSYAEYQARWATATARRNVAVTAAAVGGAALVAGGARFLIVRRHARRAEGLTLWLAPGGLGGTF
jgi:hypothetical protein